MSTIIGGKEFTWARKIGYEVSSRGDKRFSAFYATLDDGKTIEWHYQVGVKGYPSIKEGKGKPPLDLSKNLWAKYLSLWKKWAELNPALMYELRQRALAKGGRLTDMFATTPVNQAHALAHILNTTK